jgi:hypothetical protein
MHAALRERVRVRLKEDGFFGTQRFIDEFKGGSGQVGYIPHLKKMIAYVNRDIERMHVVTVRANETISKGGPRNGEEEDKNGGMGWTVFHWWEATHFRDRVVVQTFRGPTGDSSLAARNDVERQAYESRSVGIAQDRDLFGVVDMEETAQTWENAFTSTRRQALVNQVLNRPMMAIDSDPRGLIVDGQILPDSLDSRTLLFEVLTSREFRNRVQKSWLALTERSDDRLVQYAYQRLFNRDTTYDESQVIQHIASTFGYAASIAALLHSEEYEERYGQGFPTACAGQQPLISALNQADEEEES